MNNNTDNGGDSSSTINDELMQRVNLFIYFILMPFVCLFGAVASILCIVIFSKRQMRSQSLNIYLAGLSVFDLILLTLSVLIYPPMSHCTPIGNVAICEFFESTILTTYPLSLTAQACSVWTVVAITIDRFLAVTYPLHMRSWCTPRRALFVLIAITLLSIVYKLPSAFELEHNPNTGLIERTQFGENYYYRMIYATSSYLLLLFLIPWATMLVLNAFVIRAVHRAYRMRRAMTGGNQKHHSNEDRERRCTIMALVIIITFVLFNLLASVNHCIELLFGQSRSAWVRVPTSIGNLLICVNSASNIIVYIFLGKKFRQMCRTLLCRYLCWCQNNQDYRTLLMPTIGGVASTLAGPQNDATTTNISPVDSVYRSRGGQRRSPINYQNGNGTSSPLIVTNHGRLHIPVDNINGKLDFIDADDCQQQRSIHHRHYSTAIVPNARFSAARQSIPFLSGIDRRRSASWKDSNDYRDRSVESHQYRSCR